MSTQILKGTYTRRAGGLALTEAMWNLYDFIEIGGKRVENAAVDNTLDVFLKENHGKNVEASFLKSGRSNILCALRCSDGRVEQVPLRKIDVLAMISAAKVMIVPMTFLGIVVGTLIFGGAGVFIGPAVALGLWIFFSPARRSGQLVNARNALS